MTTRRQMASLLRTLTQRHLSATSCSVCTVLPCATPVCAVRSQQQHKRAAFAQISVPLTPVASRYASLALQAAGDQQAGTLDQAAANECTPGQAIASVTEGTENAHSSLDTVAGSIPLREESLVDTAPSSLPEIAAQPLVGAATEAAPALQGLPAALSKVQLPVNLHEAWVAFLSHLHDLGHFPSSSEREVAITKFVDVKAALLSFARARADLLFMLPGPELRELARAPLQPRERDGVPIDRKLRNAYARLQASYGSGADPPQQLGNAASLQDVLRVVRDWAGGETRLPGPPPPEVSAAIHTLLTRVLQGAAAPPDAAAVEAAKQLGTPCADALPSILEGRAVARARAKELQQTHRDTKFHRLLQTFNTTVETRDWVCGRCITLVYKDKQECFRCGLPVSSPANSFVTPSDITALYGSSRRRRVRTPMTSDAVAGVGSGSEPSDAVVSSSRVAAPSNSPARRHTLALPARLDTPPKSVWRKAPDSGTNSPRCSARGPASVGLGEDDDCDEFVAYEHSDGDETGGRSISLHLDEFYDSRRAPAGERTPPAFRRDTSHRRVAMDEDVAQTGSAVRALQRRDSRVVMPRVDGRGRGLVEPRAGLHGREARLPENGREGGRLGNNGRLFSEERTFGRRPSFGDPAAGLRTFDGDAGSKRSPYASGHHTNKGRHPRRSFDDSDQGMAWAAHDSGIGSSGSSFDSGDVVQGSWRRIGAAGSGSRPSAASLLSREAADHDPSSTTGEGVAGGALPRPLNAAFGSRGHTAGASMLSVDGQVDPPSVRQEHHNGSPSAGTRFRKGMFDRPR